MPIGISTTDCHGPATDWQDSYGRGQAVFGRIDCYTDYWEWNGQTRKDNDWFDGDSYGFRFRASGPLFYAYTAQMASYDPDNWIIKYADISRPALGSNNQPDPWDAFYMLGGTYSSIHISECAIRFMYVAHLAGAENWIFVKNAIGPAYGKTCIRLLGNCTGNKFRYNRFLDVDISLYDSQPSYQVGTAIFTYFGESGSHNNQIYGNIFHESGNYNIYYDNAVILAGWYGDVPLNPANGWKVYNNVFSNLGRGRQNQGERGLSHIQIVLSGTGNEVHNNVWVNMPSISDVNIISESGPILASNNWVHPAATAGLAGMITHYPTTLSGSADPFVDSANWSFIPQRLG